MLDEILRRLKVQKYAQPGRDNRCICPCHADRTGSLMVKLESDGRILMCCQAGCTTQAICEQIGIKVSDLNERPLVPGMNVHKAKTTKPAAKVQQPAAVPQQGRKVGHSPTSDSDCSQSQSEALDGTRTRGGPNQDKPEHPLPWPPTKVYDYTDEDGKLIFNVLRFTYPEGDKTFRQGVPDPSKKSGFSLTGVNKLRRPMYRLPEVVKAVREGRPVYVVEARRTQTPSQLWG